MLVNFLKINIKNEIIFLKMLTYIIYFTVLSIFLFIILLISKAINRGLEAKNKITHKKEKSFLNENNNIVDKIERLKRLKNEGTLNKIEFQKAKNKLLNK
jgi:hypothetical protein